MNLQVNRTLKNAVNLLLAEFLEKVEKIYEEHQVQFELSRAHTFDSILNFILPKFEQENINNEALSNFLQSTLNNQTEKKLKKKYCTKEITHVSGSTKLFGSSDSAFISQSFMRDSSISHKSFLSSQAPEQKNLRLATPLFECGPAKEQYISEVQSKNSDEDSNYLSKSSLETKKHYKLYSNNLKYEIISFAQKHGMKEASKKYQVSSVKIGIWERSFSKVKQARGRKPIDPQMQQKVCSWLKSQLDKGSVLTQKIIREKAKRISCSDQFKASKGWLEKFFKRRPELFKAYSQNRKISQSDSFCQESEIIAKMQESGSQIQNSKSEVKKEGNIKNEK